MDKLPDEIIYSILNFLETDYIIILSNVNKRFKNISNFFIEKEIVNSNHINKDNFIEIYKQLKLSDSFFLHKTDHFIDEYILKFKNKKICNIIFTKELTFVHYHLLNKGHNYKNIKYFYINLLNIIKKLINN